MCITKNKTGTHILFAFLGCIIFFSCAGKKYLRDISSYMNASSTETKSKYMSEDFHSFFMEKKGAGTDKKTALKEFNDWDGPLDPDVKILSHHSKGNDWLVSFNEQNDFSKLIGYPGWKGSMSFLFNNKGFISETIYYPDSTNLPYKKWLQPALDWLKMNRRNELNQVYKDNKLVKNENSANKWKELLKDWNDHKDDIKKN